MSEVYELEYREYVSRMVVEEGRKMSELSRELNISYSSIHRWVKDYKNNSGWVEKQMKKREKQKTTVYKTPKDYEKEAKEMAKENERLKRENKILKKAMHVFTENHE